MSVKKPLTGYEHYLENLLLVSKTFTDNITKDKKFKTTLKNHLFDKIDTPLKQTMSEEEKTFIKLFFGFSEISNCLERLADAEIYIRSYPNAKNYIKSGITKTKYFRYHIEKYLEESYIMNCRLTSYINCMQKFCRKSPEKLAILSSAQDLVDSGFSGLTITRGGHIHKRRYTDQDLDRLDTLELLTTNLGKGAQLKLLRLYKDKFLFPQIRRKWKKTIRSNNENLKKLFLLIFKDLNLIVFGKDGILSKKCFLEFQGFTR